MNERQKAFCEHYAANPNATAAALAAGYSKVTAYSQGQRLLKNVEIKKYLADLTATVKTERVASITETLEYLTAVMRNNEEQTRERTKAAALLADMLSEQSTSETEAVKIVIERRLIDLSKSKHDNTETDA